MFFGGNEDKKIWSEISWPLTIQIGQINYNEFG